MQPAAEDPGLIQRLKAGDQAAFDQAFRELYPLLVGVADTMLGDRLAAEDVAQEVMIELWRRRQALAIETSLRAYLIRATRNRSLNHIRHLKVRQKADPEDLALPAAAPADAGTMEGELSAAVGRAMAKLPPRCREVFELSRSRGLKYHEIAEALEISVKTVEAQMGKALSVLRDELAEFM